MKSKPAFGRALKSVRAARGMTAVDLAEKLGLGVATIALAETGKRRIDGDFIAALSYTAGLTIDERLRMAEGWGQSGAAGDEVRYDVHPSTPSGHRAAALLSSFAVEIDDTTWNRISALVFDAVDPRACRKAA